MIISVNWLKKFTDIDLSIGELAELIGARLVEVEKIIDLNEKYKDALIVKIVETSKVEDSDHLNVLKINDGGVVRDIDRDSDGLIQVVCGAPNVYSGQMVVWLPPNSVVPETYDTAEPFVLGVRSLRGIVSNGMIASAKELDLFDEHDGILEVDNELASGTLFKKAYELDDYLLDIENKSLTHRPDCFGIIGFAREVAAIQGKKFNTPEWLKRVESEFNNMQSNDLDLRVSIDDLKLSSRYQAVVLSGAKGELKSSLKNQTYLARIGVRPINAIVDVTNFLMMLTGQPLHAFDYDKVISVSGGSPDIHVRNARDGEKLTLLDGREIKMSTEDIVISAGEVAIGLAGAMGGQNTAIDDGTKRIILESATFNLYKLRATQMRHGIFSEAITRFTKGQPASLTEPVLVDAINLMDQWADAKCISKIAEALPEPIGDKKIEVKLIDLNAILGSNFTISEVTDILRNAEFSIIGSGDKIDVIAPFWRTDINIFQDVVEEVGRLSGFENIDATLPTRDFRAVSLSAFDSFRSKLRNILTRSGANEVLTYSFVHGDVIKKANQNIENSYRIVNSISPDLQYYRQTLTPSLLNLVHINIKQGYDNFAIFELNKTHQKGDGVNQESVPVERDSLSMVFSNKQEMVGAVYYRAKNLLNYLSESIGVDLVFTNIDTTKDVSAVYQPFEPKRSANILDKNTNLCIGVVGEYKKTVSKAFKLPEYTAGFELDVVNLFEVADLLRNNYKPISRYPASERDICLAVDKSLPYSDLAEQIESCLGLIDSDIDTELKLIDIYKADDSDEKKITFRLKLNSNNRTLAGDEVSATVDDLVGFVSKNIEARLV